MIVRTGVTRCWLLAWFDLEHRPERLVGQRVDEPVGPRLDLADALLQLPEHQLSPGRIALAR